LHKLAESYEASASIWEWPADLSNERKLMDDPATRSVALETLRRAWRAAVREPDSAGPAEERRRVAIAMVLGSETLDDDKTRTRAMWETCIEVTSARPLRDILRYRLARLALRGGQPGDARAWIEQCDPRPIDLESETERRLSVAHLALVDDRPGEVHELLGASDADVPIAPDFTMAQLLRAHAHAEAGDRARASDTIRETLRRFGPDVVDAVWARTPGASNPLLDEAASAQSHEDSAVARSNRKSVWIGIGVVAGLLLGPVLSLIPPVQRLISPVVCGSGQRFQVEFRDGDGYSSCVDASGKTRGAPFIAHLLPGVLPLGVCVLMALTVPLRDRRRS
jgi:hypothetical protein